MLAEATSVFGALGAGVAAGFAVAVPIGAIGVLLIETSVRRGFATAWAGAMGIATIDGIYAALAVVAGAALTAALNPLKTGIHIVSALILLAIGCWGLWTLRHPRANTAPKDVKPHRTYAKFLALTAVNPLTLVIFASLAAGLETIADRGADAKLAFAAGAFIASACWQTVLAGGGALIRARAADRARLWTSGIGYVVVLALALRVALAA